MRFTLLGNVYDDGGNERAKKFFQKAVRWIKESSAASKVNWKNILNKSYSQFLVESGSGSTLLESQCEDCNGKCSNCYIKNDKGEVTMSDLDGKVDEAFSKPYERPQTKEELSYDNIYQIKNGKLEQTAHSKREEKIYWEDLRKEKNETIEESGSLSTEEKIKAAFD